MKKFWIFLTFPLLMGLQGCEKDDLNEDETQETPSDESGSNSSEALPFLTIEDPTPSEFVEYEEIISATDEDLVENSVFSTNVNIIYSGNNVTVENDNSLVTVTNQGAHVVVNSSTGEVNYNISGSSSDGSLKIYSTKKFKVTLAGISLTNPTGAAVNIQSKKRHFVVLKEGSTNILQDGSSYSTVENEDMKATFFSEGQSIFSGSGLLNITGNCKHALCSDQYIRIRKGVNMNITSIKDAIHTNDSIRLDGGTITINSISDGFDCEEGPITVNNAKVTVVTTGEKGTALKAATDIVINGGVFDVNVKGNASKGISADGNVEINGGHLTVNTQGQAIYVTADNDISSPSAIKCDGNMVFNKATLYATSTGAAGKGISVDGTLTINDGKIVVETKGKQYVYGSLDSSPKGIKAEGDLIVNNGFIMVKASGGEGSEGMESKSRLYIKGGTLQLNCYDDCINATSAIDISGGNIYCYSSGNDGIDSNGTLTISGGLVISSGTNSPEEGFDCDQNTFKITGGIVIGTGGGTSNPTSNVCTQRSVIYGGTATKGQYLSIRNSAGESILTYAMPRTYSKMTLLFSSPKLSATESYTLTSNVSVSGGEEWNGYYLGGTYSNGTNLVTFTPSSMVTTLGNTSQGGGNPGGRPW